MLASTAATEPVAVAEEETLREVSYKSQSQVTVMVVVSKIVVVVVESSVVYVSTDSIVSPSRLKE